LAELETVYVIDDDASVRAAIEDLLLSVGLVVSAFGATRDFLAHLELSPPEGPACLVLDIRMPGQSGMEFRRQMLEQGLRFPTIFITAHERGGHEDRGHRVSDQAVSRSGLAGCHTARYCP